MATAELAALETEELEQEIAPVLAQANAITVNSAESYESAIHFLQAVKAAQKKVVEFWGPIKKAAHEAWKRTTAGEQQMLSPLEGAERAVKQKAGAYQAEEERKRVAEERRLQAIADEQARKERERLEKEAARLKTPEKQQERLEQAAMVAAPVISVAKSVPQVKGVTMKTVWKARVLDPSAVPREFLMVNEKALDAFAKSTKGNVPVSGVEFYSEQSMAVGGVR